MSSTFIGISLERQLESFSMRETETKIEKRISTKTNSTVIFFFCLSSILYVDNSIFIC